MLFHISDLVTRKSYNNDIVFKIVDIKDNIVVLKGMNVRLYADSAIADLELYEDEVTTEADDLRMIDQIDDILKLDRSEYFYLPGKILHIDGDEEYLNRCLGFYNKLNISAFGVRMNENQIAQEINKYLEDLNPDIVVITGHDAYFRKRDDIQNIDNYKNSKNFINAIKSARCYEKCQDKLVIIAGACQSCYEELIKAGANFASSPKRINIHALDPALIASSVSLSDKNKPIDLIKIIEKTKYKKDGVGGIITNGMMYTGYPR